MFSSVYVVTPPEQEPVSVAPARQHLRVDQASDDPIIAGLITAARTWAEQYLGRALLSQQLAWTVSYNRPPNSYPYLSLPLSLLVLPMWFQWPLVQQGSLHLPWEPVISVDQVSYGQFGQAPTVLVANTDYFVDTASARIRICPGSEVIPNDHIQVLFTVGYGSDPSDVPGPILTAILMLVGFLYENRGDVGGQMPMAVEMLLTPYRIVRFGD